MKAARAFIQPTDNNGRINVLYGDSYYRIDQEKKWGKEVWKNACDKARMEYTFGSNAVRW